MRNINIDIINVYISRGANKTNFLKDLGSLARGSKPCIIVGDFNIDFLADPNELIIRTILSCNFTQVVSSPTHEKGALLDHVYIKGPITYQLTVVFPYYSDHGLVMVAPN